MIGLERSILPEIAESEFHIAEKNDYKNEYKFGKEFYELMHQSEDRNTDYILLYSEAILIPPLLKLKQEKEAKIHFENIITSCSNKTYLQKLLIGYVFPMFYYHYAKNNPNQLNNLFEEVSLLIQKYKKTIPIVEYIDMQLCFIDFEINQNRLKQALKYLSELNGISEPQLRLQKLLTKRLLEIKCHFLLGNNEFCLNLIQSLQAILKEQEIVHSCWLHEFCKSLVNQLNKKPFNLNDRKLSKPSYVGAKILEKFDFDSWLSTL